VGSEDSAVRRGTRGMYGYEGLHRGREVEEERKEDAQYVPSMCNVACPPTGLPYNPLESPNDDEEALRALPPPLTATPFPFPFPLPFEWRLTLMPAAAAAAA
jgi:hypothetical protein